MGSGICFAFVGGLGQSPAQHDLRALPQQRAQSKALKPLAVALKQNRGMGLGDF